jgi:hypothetical protein
LGFGGDRVDRRIGQEILKVISPLGMEASLKAIARLTAGEDDRRAALVRQREQLEFEARRAFEQYDEVDARSGLLEHRRAAEPSCGFWSAPAFGFGCVFSFCHALFPCALGPLTASVRRLKSWPPT